MPKSCSDKTDLDKNQIIECHININSNNEKSVVSLLMAACNEQKQQLSNSEIKQAVNKGALWLTRGKGTQRLRRLKRPLKANDTLHFYYNQKVLSTTPLAAKLIADFTDYSVWYKPYGMLANGSKWSDHCTITRYVEQSLLPQRPSFLVHRLDRAATGLILIAHSKKAASALAKMFEKRQLDKQYQIIVHGDHSSLPQPQIITADVDGKSARSTFTCLNYNNELKQSLIQVNIDTGRKHQIRLHAASIGMPVVGDRLHGKSDVDNIDLQLCAVSLKFTCPLTGQAREVALPTELRPQLA
ncbi:RluA family pseudouridine synthase [Litorilituus sediminis]|uniref:RNA pseudouridine synthase n=1 Tax=Litorilituus sediminis TaxID=718192 RepID=A0A4P6P6W0_9GAMM|nr:RNA pseudouridine synthase [Litorilituus sediminis]QBG37476.1 RNA pseudouridine synthase [Litorilituus sediminis]